MCIFSPSFILLFCSFSYQFPCFSLQIILFQLFFSFFRSATTIHVQDELYEDHKVVLGLVTSQGKSPALEGEKKYKISYATGAVEEVAGIQVELNEYVGTFTTIKEDPNGPLLLMTDPELPIRGRAAQTDISPNAGVRMIFSQPVKISNNVFLTLTANDRGTQPVEVGLKPLIPSGLALGGGRAGFVDVNWVFVDVKLQDIHFPNTNYDVVIPAGFAQDMSGRPIVSATVNSLTFDVGQSFDGVDTSATVNIAPQRQKAALVQTIYGKWLMLGGKSVTGGCAGAREVYESDDLAGWTLLERHSDSQTKGHQIFFSRCRILFFP